MAASHPFSWKRTQQYRLLSLPQKRQIKLVPLLAKLTKLHIKNEPTTFSINEVPNLLLLAENLREFYYEYYEESDNSLLIALSRCSKLEKLTYISQTGKEPIANMLKDEGISKVLQECPIRDLQLYHCNRMTGEFLKTVGTSGSKLETLMLHRFHWEGRGGYVSQCDDMHIGGKLENLKQFGLFGVWNIDSQFTDSLVINAPNIRVLHLARMEPMFDVPLDQIIKLINAFDLEELHMNIEPKVGEEETDEEAEDVESDKEEDNIEKSTSELAVINALNQKKNLKSLIVVGKFSLELLKKLEMSSVTYLKCALDITTVEHLEVLHRAFPNLTDLHGLQKIKFTDNQMWWPNLAYSKVKCFNDRPNLKKKDRNVRPGLYVH